VQVSLLPESILRELQLPLPLMITFLSIRLHWHLLNNPRLVLFGRHSWRKYGLKQLETLNPFLKMVMFMEIQLRLLHSFLEHLLKLYKLCKITIMVVKVAKVVKEVKGVREDKAVRVVQVMMGFFMLSRVNLINQFRNKEEAR
jgi:hypothetical protein